MDSNELINDSILYTPQPANDAGLDGTILHITWLANYASEANMMLRVDHDSLEETYLYILYDKRTGYIYWAAYMQYTNSLKLLCQIVIKNGKNYEYYVPNPIKSMSTIKQNYILYIPFKRGGWLVNVPPFDYTIRRNWLNPRINWYKICEYINANYAKVSTGKIINNSDLRRYISGFL